MDAAKRNVNITLIYGKNELNANQKIILDRLKNIELYYCHNLHAKCYYNEYDMIISSMNLYEFSEKSNREMGVLINKVTDAAIYIDALKEIESIKNSSVLERKGNGLKIKIEEKFQDDPYSETLELSSSLTV